MHKQLQPLDLCCRGEARLDLFRDSIHLFTSNLVISTFIRAVAEFFSFNVAAGGDFVSIFPFWLRLVSPMLRFILLLLFDSPTSFLLITPC